MQQPPNDLIDVRDERGQLLFRISRDRSVIQIKHKHSVPYEVDLSAVHPIARRAATAARRQEVRGEHVKHND